MTLDAPVEGRHRVNFRSPPNTILFDLDDTILDDRGGLDTVRRTICNEAASQTPGLSSPELFDALVGVQTWFWADPERHRVGRSDLRATTTMLLTTALERIGVVNSGLAENLVAVPRNLWRLPWYAARSTFDTRYNVAEHRYDHYHLHTDSDWGDAEVTLADTGKPVGLLPGFSDLALQRLILTHPVAGYFSMTNQKLGTYRIWHDQMELTVGSVVNARFGLLERLQILTTDEMLQPHSVLVQPAIPFLIGVPPREVRVQSP